MSSGIGGYARIVMQDADTVVYEYGAYNLNEVAYLNPDHIYDGIITIDKQSLVEPEIHEKSKKQPSRKKKLITKRIKRDVDYSKLFLLRQIRVENSQFCWKILEDEVGLIAMHLIFEIFNLYQSEGILPETVCYNV